MTCNAVPHKSVSRTLQVVWRLAATLQETLRNDRWRNNTSVSPYHRDRNRILCCGYYSYRAKIRLWSSDVYVLILLVQADGFQYHQTKQIIWIKCNTSFARITQGYSGGVYSLWFVRLLPKPWFCDRAHEFKMRRDYLVLLIKLYATGWRAVIRVERIQLMIDTFGTALN